MNTYRKIDFMSTVICVISLIFIYIILSEIYVNSVGIMNNFIHIILDNYFYISIKILRSV